MSKEIEVTKDDGSVVKETVYTAEEIAAKDAEIERLNVLNGEKTENFKKVNEKTEKLEGDVNKLTETLAQKETRERESAKTVNGVRYHGNNEDLKKKVEDNYALLSGMPETTPEEIAARMTQAAVLSGINVAPLNPLNQPFSGEAPRIKPEDAKAKEDEFLKSEKGQAALKAMGMEDEVKA